MTTLVEYEIPVKEKAPGERLDFAWDYSNELALTPGDEIVDSAWVVPAGLNHLEEQDQLVSPLAIFWCDGGTVGEAYDCVNTATSAQGRIYIRTIRVFVRTK